MERHWGEECFYCGHLDIRRERGRTVYWCAHRARRVKETQKRCRAFIPLAAPVP